MPSPCRVALAVAGLALLAGCGLDDASRTTAADGGGDGAGRTVAVFGPAATAPDSVPAPGPSQALPITPAGTLPAIPTTRSVVPPVRLDIDALGIRGAAIVPVGVRPSGELEVPAADQVGWYRFGARPGEGGSSVLAAHIAYDGVNGVFHRLAQLGVDDVVRVTLADGGERLFRTVATERIPKDELPADLFARSGPSRLVLITCGGAFNPELRSYEDNVVVLAEPVAETARQ